jgi:hypothetical protein
LFVGLVGAIATALAFAQARIEANAQPELSVDLMRRSRDPKSPPST